MGRSGHETEIKLRFSSAGEARERLRSLGARPAGPREFEDNVLYDRTDSPLREAGNMLRLRRIGDRASITFKGPALDGGRYKVRAEHETPVGDPDALVRILGGLGFAPIYRYQKYRTVFHLDDLEISVDETPLGCYVELEGPPERIDRVAAKLGFGPDQFIRASYRELHERDAEARGAPVGDLLLSDHSAGRAS